MKPKEQKTSVVLEKIYSLLIDAKTKECTIYYADCFRFVFSIPYSKEFFNLITERPVINNIPLILGEIGFACNDLGLPPLSCLVVRKTDNKPGDLVVTSGGMQGGDYAMQVDLPKVYACHKYPKPGSSEAKDFLGRAMDGLRKKGVTKED
jgi:hypothetical protein